MAVTARTVGTDRLEMHFYEAGPEDGTPVVLIHGNLSTGRFYEQVMANAPAGLDSSHPTCAASGGPSGFRSTPPKGSRTGLTTPPLS